MNPAASTAIAAPAPRAPAKAAAARQAQPFCVAAAADGSVAGDAEPPAAPSHARTAESDRKSVHAPAAGDGSGMLALIASALAASAAAAGAPPAAAAAREHFVADADTPPHARGPAGAALDAAAKSGRGAVQSDHVAAAARGGTAESGDGGAEADPDAVDPHNAQLAQTLPAAGTDAGVNRAAPAHAHAAAGAVLPQGFAAFTAAAMKMLDSAGAVPSPSPAAGPAASLSLESPHWPQALADQVQWQLDGAVHEVRLDLHPQDLGSIQVQVRVDAGVATVQFRAAQPQAREALAAGLPQLRALLGADGVSLQQAQVGVLTRGERLSGAAGDSAAAAEGEVAGGPAASRSRVLKLRLLDDFA